MGVRENKVERYLDAEIQKLGGITRKWVSPGRDGVPDRLVILNGWVIGVEVKTTDGKLSEAQMREHVRLRVAGMQTVTVHGERGVDDLVETLKPHYKLGPIYPRRN